jgi:hypothetical protein
VTPGPRCWCVGVHGGAGETTLARLLTGAEGTSHHWPEHADATAAPVLLVARFNAAGLRAAQTAAATWAAGATPPVQLVGLVLLADAPGRTPRPLRDYARVLRGGLPHTWELPWVEAWRLDPDPLAAPVPRPVTRVLDEIEALIPATPLTAAVAATTPAAPAFALDTKEPQ